MFKKLFFLIAVALAGASCDKSQDAPAKAAGQIPAQNIMMTETDQKAAAAAFYKVLGGLWAQACKPSGDSSFLSYLKFTSENSGAQSIVTYKNNDCDGDDLNYNYDFKMFKYRITSVQTTVPAEGMTEVSYGIFIQFDEPSENGVSSLDTVFRVSGDEISYKIRHQSGDDLFIKLSPIQNIPAISSDDPSQ